MSEQEEDTARRFPIGSHVTIPHLGDPSIPVSGVVTGYHPPDLVCADFADGARGCFAPELLTLVPAKPAGRVIHVNDQVPDAVYIGRRNNRRRLAASPFANPFRVSDHGRYMAILLYKDYLRSSEAGRPLLAHLPALRGKPLACWCRKDGDTGPWCHGDVLLELLNRHTDDELRAIAKEH